jgi:peptidoglycan/LPS O-acetylase OafA/YrhL
VRERLAGIEGVRAVAALMVVLFHTWVWGRASQEGLGVPLLDHLLRYFYVGITVFFVLSGFLLYRPFVAAALREAPRPGLTRYAVGRVLRIVPAFWLCLYFWSLVAFGGLPPLKEVAKNFLFIQIYWPHSTASLSYYWPNPTKTLVQPAWTLCLEAAFYVTLPVLAFAIRKWAAGAQTLDRRAARQLAALALLVVTSLVYDALSLVYPWRLPVALPTVLGLFAVGMMLAVVSEWWEVRGLPRLSLRAVLALDVVAVALLVAAATVADRNVLPKPDSSALPTIFFQPLVALSTATVLAGMLLARKRTLLQRFCSLRATFWVGIVSYGVYLWHAQVVLALTLLLPDPQPDHPLRSVVYWLFDSAVVAGIVILIASLSWVAVERRLLALKTRVARGGVAAEPAVAAP